MPHPTEAPDAWAAQGVEAIEQGVLHLSWLCQRQFMQLLDGEPFRMTLPQYYTLRALQHMHGECKMSALAEATHQSAASLTGVIDRLMEKQLVARTRPATDRRQVLVDITPQGVAALVAIRRARHAQMQAALHHMSATEQAQLLTLLERMLAGLEQMLVAHESAS